MHSDHCHCRDRLAGVPLAPGRRRAMVMVAGLLLSGRASAREPGSGAQARDGIVALARPDVVVMLRHANAPGIGDPPGFRLDRCGSQRNLDEAGRAQARQLGAAWRAAGIRPTAIWSSAWCRCLDTARLMDLGPVQVLPLLNSFFGDSQGRTRQTEDLSRFIDALDARGGPYLMVTHQVNITALSGFGAESGGGIVIELPAKGRARRISRLSASMTLSGP